MIYLACVRTTNYLNGQIGIQLRRPITPFQTQPTPYVQPFICRAGGNRVSHPAGDSPSFLK
jgi:hypothetical protein